jgi:hypothetical protein
MGFILGLGRCAACPGRPTTRTALALMRRPLRFLESILSSTLGISEHATNSARSLATVLSLSPTARAAARALELQLFVPAAPGSALTAPTGR